MRQTTRVLRWLHVDDELDRAARMERIGLAKLAQHHFSRALLVEQHQLLRLTAELLARESEACVNHQLDCPDCL